MNRPPVVAIDGPAGAGKSTVAGLLSARSGLPLLDTGAMYRCVALLAHERGLDGRSAREAADLAATANIELSRTLPQKVRLNGEDVTTKIRTLEIGQLASELSVHSEVRRVLVGLQQQTIRMGGWILEGRDTTTVVAPDADLKVFLTASIEERARRRWVEIEARGESKRLQDVVRDVVERDHRDYSRADSPLALAEDAVIVETFGLTPEEVAERIVSIIPALFSWSEPSEN
ncbi:MAG: (d)CMP kinase [Fimbriimonadaceae bacterium]|nr:(d)CMP kinase [Fimbriimonadaceae bacterium]QYK58749.1 MAG: (d)CMP kinase [Fimbriimonadaceae bacterium]